MLRLPDPAATRRSRLEGWYWRLADETSGRVVVVLCGVGRPRRGAPWGLAAIAAHPGGVVRWGVVDGAAGDPDCFGAWALPLLRGGMDRVRARIGDTSVDFRLERPVLSPGPSIGPGYAMPGLPQYWHAHVLDARVRGEATIAGERWSLEGARGYAEKNWGPEFAGDWWWGQAFHDGGVSVSFAGGRIRPVPGVAVAPTAVVLRAGGSIHRLFPPRAATTVATAPGEWRVRARRGDLRVVIEGEAAGGEPHVLPVPDVDARRCDLRAAQHLTARLRLTVSRGRRVRFSGESHLAGLERGLPSASPPG